MKEKDPPKQDNIIFENITFDMLHKYIKNIEAEALDFERENKLRVPFPIPCIEVHHRVMYTDISAVFDGKNFILYYRSTYTDGELACQKLHNAKVLLRVHAAKYLRNYIPAARGFVEMLGFYKQDLLALGEKEDNGDEV